ncbi:MAG: Glyoxalase-like domain containing protein [Firmicutes bacterium]|nr:Glyoxalase-like domain containing protein [Bacillota bacterium]
MDANPVIWFEIPALDIERGKAFYEAVFNQKLTVTETSSRQMAMFSLQGNGPGISGALVKENTFVPSYLGTLVYFSVPNIPQTLKKVTENKGKLLIPETPIAPYGSVAYFEDSEGNRIGLHCML